MKVDAISLHLDDDVAILLAPVEAGGEVNVSAKSDRLVATAAIPVFHKICLRDLPGDAPLRRGGIVIGQTIGPVARGAHVHIHNLVSLRARNQPQVKS
ncbi:MAG: hypothetical protein AAGI03_15790 [Pseudomonadota bacterium]